MPVKSGFPDAVRGAGPDMSGFRSGPFGTGFGRLRHCAVAGGAKSRANAAATSGVLSRIFMRVIVSRAGCTRRHASCYREGSCRRGQHLEDSDMAATRSEIEALVVSVQQEFLQSPAVRLTLTQIAQR